MQAFQVTVPDYDDWEYIRKNGMWYGPPGRDGSTAGDETTILAELYSPVTEDFLHGLGWGDVPFLASERAASLLEKGNLNGYRLGPVRVVKVVTAGRRRGREVTGRGEPEDLVLKASNKIGVVSVPRLYAVHVHGTLSVLHDQTTGEDGETGYKSPFELPAEGDAPDLWKPSVEQPCMDWVFCSPRFKAVVEEAGLTNIRFVPFDEFMRDYRAELRRRAQGTADGPAASRSPQL